MVEPNGAPPGFAAQLAALSTEFAIRQGQLLGELDRRLAEQEASVLSEALLREAHDLMHRLAGSGGSFGFDELSRQARALEQAAQTWLLAEQPLREAEWQAWKSGVQSLRRLLEADRAPGAQ